MQFEVREGTEGERTPETDLARHHQILEEGDKFKSLFLRLDRCCFLALVSVNTHLLRTFWNALRLPSVRFAFQEEKASFAEPLPHHRIQCTMGRKKGKITEDEMGIICAR